MSFTGIPELREAHRQMGAARFWRLTAAVLGGIVCWTVIGIWLEGKVGWPEHYGFRCRGRGCWIDDLWHSPALLRTASPIELGLFAWIWSIPSMIPIAFIYARIRKRRERTLL